MARFDYLNATPVETVKAFQRYANEDDWEDFEDATNFLTKVEIIRSVTGVNWTTARSAAVRMS